MLYVLKYINVEITNENTILKILTTFPFQSNKVLSILHQKFLRNGKIKSPNHDGWKWRRIKKEW